MTGQELRSFVTRTQSLLESAPPTSGRETHTWLVDPFLETLGWDVHADDCRTNAVVDETGLEYVFSVDAVPALFVAVEPADESLQEARAAELLEAMAWSGVDRGIYTNGRDYVFLAGTTDADRLACRLPALPEYGDSIEHFSRTAIERHLERHSREFVARRFALERSELVESIVDHLTGLADENEVYADEFRAAAERFLDRLIVSFADEDAAFDAESGDVALAFTDPTTDRSPTGDSDESTGAGSTSRSQTIDSNPKRRGTTDRSDPVDAREATSSTRSDGASEDGRVADGTSNSEGSTRSRPNGENGERASDAAEESHGTDDGTDDGHGDGDAEGDGEFVVRFFNERGSIGAIGHSSSRAALAHAAEYLFERGLSGVRVPWSPDGEPTVLHEEPVRDDGTPMERPQQLSSGYYLETGGSVADHARRVRAMAARANLRVMLTGSWESATS
ncbi:hypothetical protein [Halopiger goleimassiliensis]|uniref:hypothetical protein n=1 Tax=Halopiger goleimassiliensis TaxID=1293048 RepID=UPI00067773DE|nr:hypothetical protein [Halopiger goleimassiliensis]